MSKLINFLRRDLSDMRIKDKAYAGTVSLLVLALIVGLNLIVSSLPSQYTKIDMTDQQLFSLSPETQGILQNLTADIDIYYVATTAQEDIGVTGLMEKYTDLSPHINTHIVDPIANPGFLSSYGSAAASAGSIVVDGNNGRTRTIDASDLYTLTYDATTFSETSSFAGEAMITSAVSYVTTQELPKIYLTHTHGEADLATFYTDALAHANILVEYIDLTLVDAVPDDADTIFINAPMQDFTAAEISLLTDYKNSGGSVFLITNYGEYDTAEEPMPNLVNFTKTYGMAAQQGIVVEMDDSYFITQYPHYLLPEIIEHDITSPISDTYILAPLAHPIEIFEPEGGFTSSSLLTTTDSSFSKADAYSSATFDKEEGDVDGPFSVAAAAQNSDTNAKFVWLPTSGFVDEATDQLVGGNNRNFFLNIISWCTGKEDGITVHAKPLSEEFLTVPQSFSTIFSIVFTIVLPVALLIGGFAIWYLRRKR